MKQPEYIEGQKARENFEKFTSALLQVPKKPRKAATKEATSRKASGSDKG